MEHDENLSSWQVSEPNICAIFENSAKTYSKLPYCCGSTNSLTYEQAFCAADAMAAELGSDLRGKIVGIYLPNNLAFLITHHAVLRAGGRPALFNVATPKASITKLLSEMDISLIFATENVPGVPTRIVSDTDLTALAQANAASEITPAKVSPDDTHGHSRSSPRTYQIVLNLVLYQSFQIYCNRGLHPC